MTSPQSALPSTSLTFSSSAAGPSGPSDKSCPSAHPLFSADVLVARPAGPTGSSIASSFAFTGCYQQTCLLSCNLVGITGLDSLATGGGFVANLVSTASNPAGRQCAVLCQNRGGANYMGLVNVAGSTTNVACYCGVQISSASILDTNCGSCNPGAGSGTCGTSGLGIAIYGRGY